MTQSAAQASAFYIDVAKNKKVWTIRDLGGFPAPMTPEGKRSQPFWSTYNRVIRIITTVPAYTGFEPFEISWDDFSNNWLPGLDKDGLLVGLNWSGNRAIGFDIKPIRVKENIETLILMNSK